MLWSSNFCTSLIAVSRSEASLWSISQSISSLATKQFGYVLRWCRRSLMTFSSCSRSLGVKSPCEYYLQKASVTSKIGTRVEQRHPSPAHRMGFAGVGWKRKRLGHMSSAGVWPPGDPQQPFVTTLNPILEKLVFCPVEKIKKWRTAQHTKPIKILPVGQLNCQEFGINFPTLPLIRSMLLFYFVVSLP